MFWRRFKLDWSYAVGELFIVIVGVLVALVIDQWNDDRLEQAEEVEVLSRIISDIDLDLQAFTRRLNSIDAKEESLLRVRTALVNTGPTDSRQLLRDIIAGADYGWNQGLSSRATFDDLLGSGRLQIISAPEIRAQLAGYYQYYEDSINRIDERETAYPGISYQLVPRSGTSKDEGEFAVWERELEQGLSDEYRDELVKGVQESSIANHVTAEINLARFIRGVTRDLQSQAISLTNQLQEYQAGVE